MSPEFHDSHSLLGKRPRLWGKGATAKRANVWTTLREGFLSEHDRTLDWWQTIVG
jgi:hypothetical protein